MHNTMKNQPSDPGSPTYRVAGRKVLHSIQIMLILFIMATMQNQNLAGQSKLGDFTGSNDVGKVKIAGSATYNEANQTYTLEGSGTNIWFNKDEFQYLWKKLKGNFILTARVSFMGKGVEAHRKIGWMIRQSLDTSSAHVSAVIHGDGLTSLQYRKSEGANMEEVKSDISAPDVVQLERRGNTYIMSVARFGNEFTRSEITLEGLGDEVYAGLFICAHNPDVMEKAIFSDVRITIPPREGYVPYRDYIGSKLEVMDVETGMRKVLYRYAKSLQAPNWTVDGKTLIYNCEGKLYNFDLSTLKPVVLNTGRCTMNNNDHVLSFDGKMIGISDHSQDKKGNSLVFVLPSTGGEPTQVTPEGPSYMHGWSPDKKYVIYTGERNGEFDIYKKPVKGGKEVRLTTAKGLDDGSEYSPDGKYIYFNSNRTGKMQIWRMKPDGSEQVQLTKGELNDWFPHVSPDGKWIVFISFPAEVDPGDHPFYKHVYLRMMQVTGGEPKVIAYLFGGQGTMNVPSWSPDSKKIAFVSNTDF